MRAFGRAGNSSVTNWGTRQEEMSGLARVARVLHAQRATEDQPGSSKCRSMPGTSVTRHRRLPVAMFEAEAFLQNGSSERHVCQNDTVSAQRKWLLVGGMRAGCA